MIWTHELFGGAGRAKTLAYLFENSRQSFGVRELAQLTKVDPGNLSRWLKRWTDEGLLERTASTATPRYAVAQGESLKPLVRFFQLQSSWAKGLQAQLQALGDDVDAAAVFGSMAAGSATADSDLDLLVLTDLPRVRAQAAFKAVARDLHKTVNVLAYTREHWEGMVQDGNPLALDILQHDVLPLKGDLHVAAQA